MSKISSNMMASRNFLPAVWIRLDLDYMQFHIAKIINYLQPNLWKVYVKRTSLIETQSFSKFLCAIFLHCESCFSLPIKPSVMPNKKPLRFLLWSYTIICYLYCNDANCWVRNWNCDSGHYLVNSKQMFRHWQTGRQPGHQVWKQYWHFIFQCKCNYMNVEYISFGLLSNEKWLFAN